MVHMATSDAHGKMCCQKAPAKWECSCPMGASSCWEYESPFAGLIDNAYAEAAAYVIVTLTEMTETRHGALG